MKTISLAILGYGNAGRAFGRLLLEKIPEIKEQYDVDVIVTAIATKTKGSLTCETGIDLKKIEQELAQNRKFTDGISMCAREIATSSNYDVLVEITPLDIFSGQPAIDHMKIAFSRGKHVITANKGPLAWAFDELKTLAEKNNSKFFYESTVMDGTPIFNLYENTLKGCKLIEFRGILNTTTNFILKGLEDGIPYEDIIAEGKRRGFVEADPNMDIEGYDSAAKTAVLMNVLFDAKVTPLGISRKGIEDITPEMLVDAKKRGKTIKLMCGGSFISGKSVGYVRPEEIEAGDLFATINDTASAISISTDLMGKVSVIQHDSEVEQTAYGLFGDLLRVIESRQT